MHMNKTHVSYLNRLFTTNGDNQMEKGNKRWVKLLLIRIVNGTNLEEFDFEHETHSSIVIEQTLHQNGKAAVN